MKKLRRLRTRGLAALRPGMRERLAQHGLRPDDTIPGYRVTYRELDNVCQLMVWEGWAGGIGLDEAVAATAGRLP